MKNDHVERLNKYLKSANDLSASARLSWIIFNSIHQNFQALFNISREFFVPTYYVHLNQCILNITKLFDDPGKSKNIGFKKIISVAKSHRTKLPQNPSHKQLESIKEKIESYSKEKISKLKNFRDNEVAHNSNLTRINPCNVDLPEIEDSLRIAHEVLNDLSITILGVEEADFIIGEQNIENFIQLLINGDSFKNDTSKFSS